MTYVVHPGSSIKRKCCRNDLTNDNNFLYVCLSKILFIVTATLTFDPKINRALPLPQGIHVAKFGKDPINRTKVIVRKPVWTPIIPNHIIRPVSRQTYKKLLSFVKSFRNELLVAEEAYVILAKFTEGQNI
jgi:hypothetical protein